jgi:flagellar P-ring protein FlgI
MKRTLTFILLLSLMLLPRSVQARTLLKNICHVKGQEENSLHGLGLIVGLNGTGDGADYLPTIRSLATALQLMGSPQGKTGAIEVKAKNVALVTVTATVPAAGARQGDQLDCTVSSIGSAKSLNGGILFMTPLQGPQRTNKRVYGIAQGMIHIDDPKIATNGKIQKGCRLEADFFNSYAKDGKITLVLDKHHADFQVAQEIAELINSQLAFQTDDRPAKALDQVNIEVKIPQQYLEDPVDFVSQIMSMPTLDPQGESRVVINERAGSIVIDGNVEIGSVVVTHKNIVIETGTNVNANQFIEIDPAKTGNPKLRGLVESLSAVKVPTADIVEIIKGLDRNGKLHAELIIE